MRFRICWGHRKVCTYLPELFAGELSAHVKEPVGGPMAQVPSEMLGGAGWLPSRNPSPTSKHSHSVAERSPRSQARKACADAAGRSRAGSALYRPSARSY